jgi:hypothetical protein
MSRKASYILLSAIVLAVVGIVIIALAPDSYRCRQFYSAIISLTVFYTALNAFSLNFHGIISKQKNAYLTQFYLIDKTIRFILSIILISILLYLNKSLGIAISAFAYYVAAMVVEITYFVTVDKKIKIRNA